MGVAEIQGFGYVIAGFFLVIGFYAYIYHLYTKRKDASGRDYEEYSNIALNDDIDDTPVSSMSDKKDK